MKGLSLSTVVEHFCVGRSENVECEDILVLEKREGQLVFAAVIDGVTDKSKINYGGHTGGRLAAEEIAKAICALPADIDPYMAVRQITASLADLRKRLNVSSMSTTPPSASATIYSATRREVWRVGDCHIGVIISGKLMPYPGDKAVDVAASLARAAYTSCLLAGGHLPDDVAASDPGRTFIRPLLEAQGVLANSKELSPFAYGVFDGSDVPTRLIEVLPLPVQACEVVLATDGYIGPASSLKEAEELLERSVKQDPLRIGPYRGTKATGPGANSFDDRTWVRIDVPKSTSSSQAEPKLRRRITW